MGGTHTSDLKREPKRKIDWGKYGRKPLILLALVAFIDSVDRNILPGVLSLVQDDLGISDSQAGFFATAAILMSFVVVIPAGYMADRFQRTRVIAIALGSWAVLSAMNAGVRNYAQFLAVRAGLGAGETIDNPASSSLIADYYPVTRRARAYAYLRVAPTIGTGIGIALAGLVGALVGWRAAFLIVGVPGSLLAIWAWRMKEPRRGESDGDGGADGELLLTAARRGLKPLLKDIRLAASVPSLRALMIGSAISAGATQGFGFWAPEFYERHTTLGVGESGFLVAALILPGAVIGTILGGRAADKARGRDPGAPMRLAGTTQAIAAVIFFFSFFPVPIFARIPMHIAGVAFLLAAFPALTAMISEVVPATMRGISFSVSGFLGAIISAFSPPLVGAISDAFPITVDGDPAGNLALAFAVVTPLILIGALIVLRGRRFVESDIERVPELAAKLEGS